MAAQAAPPIIVTSTMAPAATPRVAPSGSLDGDAPLREIYKALRTVSLSRRFSVQRVIRCDCGFEATGFSDDDLVPIAQAHARVAHDTEVSADLVLALARPHPGPAIRPTTEET